jgi:uncharacterized protein
MLASEQKRRATQGSEALVRQTPDQGVRMLSHGNESGEARNSRNRKKVKMSESRPKPFPVPDETTLPFWEAAKHRQLAIQRCVSCGYYNHPPRIICDACLSQELRFEPVSGRGRIHTFTVMHQRDVPGFESEAPFINVVVELVEQPMLLMVSNLPISSRERVGIGAPVEVEFEDRGDDVIVPQFRIVG